MKPINDHTPLTDDQCRERLISAMNDEHFRSQFAPEPKQQHCPKKETSKTNGMNDDPPKSPHINHLTTSSEDNAIIPQAGMEVPVARTADEFVERANCRSKAVGSLEY